MHAYIAPRKASSRRFGLPLPLELFQRRYGVLRQLLQLQEEFLSLPKTKESGSLCVSCALDPRRASLEISQADRHETTASYSSTGLQEGGQNPLQEFVLDRGWPKSSTIGVGEFLQKQRDRVAEVVRRLTPYARLR